MLESCFKLQFSLLFTENAKFEFHYKIRENYELFLEKDICHTKIYGGDHILV